VGEGELSEGPSSKIERKYRGRFNEDMIRRRGLPQDVRELIHDLCYDHEGRDRKNYQRRAQEIMKREKSPSPVGKVRLRSNGFKCRGCSARVKYAGDYCGECICEDDGI
jgi:hypothetical protein